jgi:hypothetical protein
MLAGREAGRVTVRCWHTLRQALAYRMFVRPGADEDNPAPSRVPVCATAGRRAAHSGARR